MSLKKIVGLTVLGLVLLVIGGGITVLILVRMRPSWYQYQQLSPKEMLAAKEDMIYMETSAKNNKNVDKLFKSIAKYGITVNNNPKEQERYERTCTPCQYDQNNRTYECCF